MSGGDDFSTLLHKGPCDHCGSSDARAVYDDGHSFCFACPPETAHDSGDGIPSGGSPSKPKRNQDLINNGEYRELAKRSLRLETCRFYGYTVAESGGRTVQVANYRDQSGEVIGQKVRTPDKDFFALGNFKSKPLFGQHLVRSGGKRIIITEGEIDAMSVGQATALKYPALSVPTGAKGAAAALKANLEFLNTFEEVILWFDQDEVGREAIDECITIFPAGKVKVIVTPHGCKDANELLQKHGDKAVLDASWSAQVKRPDGVITGEDLTKERLKAKAQPGWQTPYPKVNELTRGIRPRQLWLITAGTGVGKSTDAREWAYAALCEGKSVGMVFLEESVEDTGKYLVALDNNILAEDLEDDPDILTDEQWDASLAKVLHNGRYQSYDHFGAQDSDSLLSKLDFMAANGAELIFLDHLTLAVTGKDNDGQDVFLAKLRSLTERTGCSIVAIAHLRKSSNGSKPAEEGGRISSDDVKGSGAFKQLVDVLLAKERNQQAETEEERDISMIRVLKVRRGGRTGPADYLKYDKVTGRLRPCEKPDFPDADGSPDF